MQKGNHAMTHDADNDPALIPALRWMSNMACLWGLCRNAACGRARQCRRDPRFCMRRCAPLVPEQVRSGVAFMLDGNMLCGTYRDRGMYRVGKANEGAALELPHVRPMTMTGRAMPGLVEADREAIADPELRGRLLGLALDFVGALPFAVQTCE